MSALEERRAEALERPHLTGPQRAVLKVMTGDWASLRQIGNRLGRRNLYGLGLVVGHLIDLRLVENRWFRLSPLDGHGLQRYRRKP